MADYSTPAFLAKQVAFHDITVDCQQQRRQLKISPADPMGPQNCLPWENAICEYAGVFEKPDFRKFNGGWNRGLRKGSPIYVTYRIKGKHKRRAVECESEQQSLECKDILNNLPGVTDIRICKCGRIKKKPIVVSFKKFKTL